MQIYEFGGYKVIILEKISKAYGDLIVLDEFDLQIEEGKVTCLFGPSGCGKTTLLNVVSELIKKDSGRILGLENKRISYIFQEPRLIPWMTVEENIHFVIKNIILKEKAEQLIIKYLEYVDLIDFKNHYPHELSGGMKQRVAIVRAFAYPSQLLMMDEPFQGLDKELKMGLIGAFKKIWEREKRTVLLVTHNEEDAKLLANEIYYLTGLPLRVNMQKR